MPLKMLHHKAKQTNRTRENRTAEQSKTQPDTSTI